MPNKLFCVQLYLKYPNKDLILSVRTIDKPPTVHIRPQVIDTAISGAMDFYVVDDDGSTALAFTLGVVSNLYNIYSGAFE